MKLSEFLDRIKLQNPNLGQQNIGDAFLTSLINQAVDQVNILTHVYKGYTDFNIEAGKRIYDLSSVAPLFLGTDKRGLYFKNSDGKWDKVTSKTEAWISKLYPDYLNASSVDVPLYYWTDGNELGFYPPPLTAKTAGARIYHLKKSGAMNSNDYYPWTGSATQIVSLLPLDDAILAYVRWKISPQFGNVSDVDLRYREFLLECRKGKLKINTRLDQSNDGNGMTVS